MHLCDVWDLLACFIYRKGGCAFSYTSGQFASDCNDVAISPRGFQGVNLIGIDTNQLRATQNRSEYENEVRVDPSILGWGFRVQNNEFRVRSVNLRSIFKVFESDRGATKANGSVEGPSGRI